MSAHALNMMLTDLFRSEKMRAQCLRDPDNIIAKYDLTVEERERFKANDMGWLYLQGVQPYILVQYALAIGYNMEQYVKQVREATGHCSAGFSGYQDPQRNLCTNAD